MVITALPWRANKWEILECFYMQFNLYNCSHLTITTDTTYIDTLFHWPCPGQPAETWAQVGGPGRKPPWTLLNSPVHPKAQLSTDKVHAPGHSETPSQLQQQWLDSGPDPPFQTLPHAVTRRSPASGWVLYRHTWSRHSRENSLTIQEQGRGEASTTPLGPMGPQRWAARPHLTLGHLGFFSTKAGWRQQTVLTTDSLLHIFLVSRLVMTVWKWTGGTFTPNVKVCGQSVTFHSYLHCHGCGLPWWCRKERQCWPRLTYLSIEKKERRQMKNTWTNGKRSNPQQQHLVCV